MVQILSSNKSRGNDLAVFSGKSVFHGHRPSVQQIMQEAGEQELP
jgi:uncharacterized protein (DUF2237 family)